MRLSSAARAALRSRLEHLSNQDVCEQKVGFHPRLYPKQFSVTRTLKPHNRIWAV